MFEVGLEKELKENPKFWGSFYWRATHICGRLFLGPPSVGWFASGKPRERRSPSWEVCQTHTAKDEPSKGVWLAQVPLVTKTKHRQQNKMRDSYVSENESHKPTERVWGPMGLDVEQGCSASATRNVVPTRATKGTLIFYDQRKSTWKHSANDSFES